MKKTYKFVFRHKKFEGAYYASCNKTLIPTIDGLEIVPQQL